MAPSSSLIWELMPRQLSEFELVLLPAPASPLRHISRMPAVSLTTIAFADGTRVLGAGAAGSSIVDSAAHTVSVPFKSR